ncbi:MAG: GGDEF domain-containing protein [Treponema sp.]|jgi:diguanylate cyclase (GGDEF)-like protein|nr:GGDEF domain-containing protein [Treponema sp.]
MSDFSNTEDIHSEIIYSAVSKLSLFSFLSEDEFKIVSVFLKLLKIKKDDAVFKEGDTGADLFIHFSGTLSAYRAQADGTMRWLFDVKQGDFFGEMSIIAHEPRSATIKAVSHCLVITLSGEEFYQIISEHPVIGFKILKAISVVQNRWLDQTSKSYSDLMRWGETARRRAITDEMTGLHNRLFLEESIKERFSNPSMSLRVMSLLMMDLDKIHAINESYGSKAGDLIIKAAADMIIKCVRPGDIAARLSGDEFAVLLNDTDKTDAIKIAERIRKNIENKKVEAPEPASADSGPEGRNLPRTVFLSTRTSIGIAISPVHAKSKEDLEEKADLALRKAKELGRNRVEVYTFNKTVN